MKSLFVIGLCALAAALVAAQAAPVDEAQIAKGKRLFAETCANDHCHGGSARSVVDMTGLTPERVRKVIVEGLPDAGMQSFKDVYTEPEIEALVAYVISASADHGKGEDRTCHHLR